MTRQQLQNRTPISVVAVGQTPPPYHGQAIMIKMLLDGTLEDVELHHVRMAFSSSMEQVGRLQIAKVFHLVELIVRVLIARLRFGATVLYYPPTGPNRVPLIRDIVFLLATRWAFRKTVFHFHASGLCDFLPRQPRLVRWLAHRALNAPDAGIQISPLAAPDSAFLNAKRIFTIPNATYDEATRMGWDSSQRLRGTVTKFLFVGTVCESKGVMVLLKACGLLKKEGLEFQLDIVGAIPSAEFELELRKRLREESLEDCVVLHGQQTGDAKWRFFANADVFCFLSHYESESFGCVLIEAMSFSLPVVATRWRGIPSIVEDGTTGFLVNTHDAQACADRMRTLARDVRLSHAMGQASRAKFLSCYTVKEHLESMRQVFIEISH